MYLSEVLFLSHGGGTGLWGGGGNSSPEGLELRSHDSYLGSAERAKFRTLESYTYSAPPIVQVADVVREQCRTT